MGTPYKNSPNVDTKKVFAEGLQDGSAVIQAHGYLFDTSLLMWVAQTGTYAGGGNVTVNNYVAPSNEALKIYVSADGITKFICKAPIGSVLSSAVWQIKKVNTSSGVDIQWCDGNANYDNTATNLLIVEGHSYSY